MRHDASLRQFLAHVVLPDGRTFGEWAEPELARVYDGGAMPAPLALGRGD